MYRYSNTSIILRVLIAVLFILGLVLECSCERSEEPKQGSAGFITYTLRWDSVIPGFPAPEKLRYCIYPSEGGPMIQTDGDANGITLFLPPDKYNVLIFNYDAKNIDFRNMSKFEEAEAYLFSIEKEGVSQDKATPLYIASFRSVEVKADMESHKELILSPVLLPKDGSLNLSNRKEEIDSNVNELK